MAYADLDLDGLEAAQAFTEGDSVVARGLLQAHELNGQTGVLLEFVAFANRWVVDFGHPHGERSLKPQNIFRQGPLSPIEFKEASSMKRRRGDYGVYDSEKATRLVDLGRPTHAVAVSSRSAAPALKLPLTVRTVPRPAMKPDDLSGGDIKQQQVLVMGDSVLRGCSKLFKSFGSRWRTDAWEGDEALSVRLEPKDLQQFDHVIYCTAGNGMWKKVHDKVYDNVRFWDASKVAVVFLGNTALWRDQVGQGQAVPHPEFFDRAKAVLDEFQITHTETVEFMETLEYCDEDGHPSKGARWTLVEHLVGVFQELVDQKARRA